MHIIFYPTTHFLSPSFPLSIVGWMPIHNNISNDSILKKRKNFIFFYSECPRFARFDDASRSKAAKNYIVIITYTT